MKNKLYALLLASSLGIGCVSGMSATTQGKLQDWKRFIGNVRVSMVPINSVASVICASGGLGDMSDRCGQYRKYSHLLNLSLIAMDSILDEWSGDISPDNGAYIARLNGERARVMAVLDTVENMRAVDSDASDGE